MELYCISDEYIDFIGAQELCDEWNEKIKKDSKQGLSNPGLSPI